MGDDRLTGTKYVWSYGEENVPDKHRERLASLTARGMMRKLKTARAWSIKESLRDMWKCRSRVDAYSGQRDHSVRAIVITRSDHRDRSSERSDAPRFSPLSSLLAS